MNKVGILGGTFDPIHNGHLYIASEALEILNLDHIIFMPSGNPPHKISKEKTDGKIRYELVRRAIKNYEGFVIDSYEIDKRGLSYTFETLEYLREKFGKETELYFITGADCLIDIYKWKNIKKIFINSTLVVFNRPGYDIDKLFENKKKVEEEFNTKIIFLPLLILDISSTYIREKIKNGKNVDFFIPEDVSKYIKELNLYKE